MVSLSLFFYFSLCVSLSHLYQRLPELSEEKEEEDEGKPVRRQQLTQLTNKTATPQQLKQPSHFSQL